MGNVINKDNDTMNWNNIKTDKFSESNNTLFLSDDSKLLASKLVLNIPEVVVSESDGFTDVEKIFNKYQVINGNNKTGTELSDTSPFISSEMYKYLMNKNQVDENIKVGGGLKQKGGAIEEDSSTSSTSSSGNVQDKPKHNKQHDKKGNKKNHKEHSEKEHSEEGHSEEEHSEEESVGGASDDLSYVSSSAHTGSNQQSEQGNSNESTTAKSSESISNYNNEVPPSSINTSDINMISESS